MTEDELYEQNQRNLDASIREHFERSRMVLEPVRTGPHATLQDVAEATAINAFRRVKHNRAYALDDTAKLELAALAIATKQKAKNLYEILQTLASVMGTKKVITKRVIVPNGPDKIEEKELPDWLQLRPPADVGVVPPLPVDPVTGERIANPWIGKLDADKARSRRIIEEQSPRQARWLQDCAKNGGPTAAMLDELESERIEADHLRKLPYSEAEWAGNKLRHDIEPNVTNRMLFEKSIADPWLVKFHRQEAEAGSPRLGFDSLTVGMAIAKHDPELRELHKAAHEILANWKAEAEQKAAA
jgi:hypothetical protein